MHTPEGPVATRLFGPALRVLAALAALAAAAGAVAQQNQPANGLFLIAKPTLTDPNFARTVVLVTQADDASTVGVIINRPTSLKLADMLQRGQHPIDNYRHPVYFGGPVMRQVVVSLFRSEKPPEHAAFHILKTIYLTMHPDNIASLLADPQARYRLYVGFAGWAPRQLESEFMRDGWFVLPADEATLFRDKTDGLWEELVERVKRLGPRASR